MAMELTSVDGTASKTLDGLEATVMRGIVKFMVQRDILCQVSGQVLDLRTVVAIFNRAGDDVIAVLSPQGWAERKGALLAHVGPNFVWHHA